MARTGLTCPSPGHGPAISSSCLQLGNGAAWAHDHARLLGRVQPPQHLQHRRLDQGHTPCRSPRSVDVEEDPAAIGTSAGVVVRCLPCHRVPVHVCRQAVGDDRGIFVLRGISGETFSLSSAPVRVRGLVGLQNVVGLGVSRVVDPIIVAVSVPIRHLCARIARLAERFPDPVVPCRGRA